MIANRGEIAVRIARAAATAGLESVAVHSADGAGAPHAVAADRAVALPGEGPAAYLAIDRVLAAACEAGCDAVHPGYGFLSENAAFARACADAGLVFVGRAPICSRCSATRRRPSAMRRRPACRCSTRRRTAR